MSAKYSFLLLVTVGTLASGCGQSSYSTPTPPTTPPPVETVKAPAPQPASATDVKHPGKANTAASSRKKTTSNRPIARGAANSANTSQPVSNGNGNSNTSGPETAVATPVAPVPVVQAPLGKTAEKEQHKAEARERKEQHKAEAREQKEQKAREKKENEAKKAAEHNPIVALGSTSAGADKFFDRGIPSAILEARMCRASGHFSSGARCYAAYEDGSIEWVTVDHQALLDQYIETLQAKKKSTNAQSRK